tara:strand:+ start:1233 stop:1457 length:225 start_codon:yes stop_codon:yes gene_type:complete
LEINVKHKFKKINNKEIIKLIFAKDKPRKEKIISSHFVSGTCSRCNRRSSMFSNESVVEVHPTSKSTNPLSTRE